MDNKRFYGTSYSAFESEIWTYIIYYAKKLLRTKLKYDVKNGVGCVGLGDKSLNLHLC